MIPFCILILVAGYIAYKDIAKRCISNWSVIIVAIAALISSEFNAITLLPFFIAVTIGLVLFTINAFAGGDIKLMLAFLLGIDTQWWPAVLILTGMIGGLLALAYICYGLYTKKMADVREKGLPYGVPITLAGVCGVFLTSF